jgi:SNF2 family DNA or RNA helicase
MSVIPKLPCPAQQQNSLRFVAVAVCARLVELSTLFEFKIIGMAWVCVHCSFQNKQTTTRCRVCHLKNQQLAISSSIEMGKEISCPRCTLLNPMNSSCCGVCGHVLLPSQNNSSSKIDSPHDNHDPDENQRDSGSGSDDNESDCEEKMLFELISEQIDEFVETIKQNNEIRYRCKFDGRICGTKSIMCAYVARRHKTAALQQLKQKESKDREGYRSISDEALAWKLAILDYETAPTTKRMGRPKKSSTAATNVRSASLPSSLSSSRRASTVPLPPPPPKTEPRKKKRGEYTPLPPSAYFRNRQSEANIPTSGPKSVRPKVEFNLTSEDKETRLKKLLQRSDQIVSRLAQLIPPPLPPASTKTSEKITEPYSIPSHSLVEQTDSETPCSLQGDEISDAPIIPMNHSKDLPSPPTISPSLVIDYPLLQGCTLRSYQSAGVEWLCGLHDAGLNGILADEMGLGIVSAPPPPLFHIHC